MKKTTKLDPKKKYPSCVLLITVESNVGSDEITHTTKFEGPVIAETTAKMLILAAQELGKIATFTLSLLGSKVKK